MLTTPQPAKGSLKERQRQEREALIFATAEELILEQGYSAMAIEDIATRVGIAKGTVYLHFPSKQDLVMQLLLRNMRTFYHHFAVTLDADLLPSAKLRSIIDLVCAGMFSHHFKIMFEIVQDSEMRAYLEANRASWQAMNEQFAQRISAVIEAGKDQGEIDPTLPTAIVVHVFGNLLAPKGFVLSKAREQFSPTELATYISRFFFRGIAAETPPERS